MRGSRWLFRVALAIVLALALWLGWERVRPSPRVGDVPFVTTPHEVIDRMLELGHVGRDDLVYDLGSGDGRVVIRAAQRFGARGRGIEIDPLLVRDSRRAAATAGVGERVEFVEGDLFDVDLGGADAVTLYLLPSINLALRPRLLAQLAPGTRVVSHAFDMAEWQPDEHAVVAVEVESAAADRGALLPTADVYAWTVPAAAAGVWTLEIGGAEAPPADPEAPPADADVPSVAAATRTDGGGLPSERLALRLLQRFQELEGELRAGAGRILVSGRLDGRRLQLETQGALSGWGALRLVGVVDGDRLSGELSSLEDDAGADAGPPTRSFVAARAPASPIGEWQIEPGAAVASDVGFSGAPGVVLVVDRQPGGLRARLVSAGVDGANGAAPTGPIGADAPDRPLDEVYVWGSGVAFFVDASAGPARRIAYYGVVEDDRMRGIKHDGGALVPWTARRRGAQR